MDYQWLLYKYTQWIFIALHNAKLSKRQAQAKLSQAKYSQHQVKQVQALATLAIALSHTMTQTQFLAQLLA